MADALSIATALIKHVEGVRLAPYQDVAGLWSIGYGNRCCTNGLPVTQKTQPLAMYEADYLLRETLLRYTEPTLMRLVHRALTSYQNGALCSFIYNIGGGAFASSSFLRLLNAGDVAGASDQFGRWVYAGGKPVAGLLARRTLEKAIFDGTIDAMSFDLPMVPGPPHPVFTSSKVTLLSPSLVNVLELACLRLKDLIPEALR